ncbi:MAG: aminotransferase class V-fold PLP-dependent enzyme [Thermoprotei archaeon]
MTKKVYLAACSHSPLHRAMVDSLEEYKRDLEEYGNPWDLWVEKVGEAKDLFARLIGAKRDEVAPSFSVSTALDTLLSGFNYSSRREIITSDLEYPTTNFILLAQQKRGARVVTLRNEDYTITPEKYIGKLNSNTRLVTAIHVSSINGFKQDVKGVVEASHRVGAEVYVDSYQAAGNTVIDVRKMDVDYLASGTLKYLLGLPGLAFLYVRQDLIPKLEPEYTGWFSQKDPFLFGATNLDYADTADRFQTGTWGVPSIYASIAGLKTILEVGVENVERQVVELTHRALEVGDSLGLQSISPRDNTRRGAIVSFVVKNPHQLELKLNRMGFITSSRGIGLRLAPHFYNTKDEIERAVEAIAKENGRE